MKAHNRCVSPKRISTESTATPRELEPMPLDLEPMQARSAKRPPDGEGWAFELKWDGVRALLRVEDGEARITSRRGEDVTDRYPELTEIAAALGSHEALIDGEIVVFDPEGKPSFQLLQRRMGLTATTSIRRRSAETAVTYIAFDLLWLDGHTLCDNLYEERRRLLAELDLDGPRWQLPAHHVGDGAALLEAVRSRGLEGIVAKRLDGPYRPGRRSSDWVRVKCRRRQELVIGGFLPGEGARAGRVGSLLVGHWDATPDEAKRLGRGQRLVYAGGVGSGLTERTLDGLTAALEPLRRASAPFVLGEDPALKYAQRSRERGAIAWCDPRLVCEVEFAEWTRAGTLRAASFKGLRDDKDPYEVVRERS
jgi:bifunctional non-homologous end joining protein LigD